MRTYARILILALAILVTAPVASAQKSQKQLKKEMKSKVLKENKKAAKQLTKQGWKVMPGKLPLERQLQDSRYAELDVNDKGGKRYFIGTHQAVGGNYSAAKQIADDRARLELAQAVCGEMTQKIEGQLGRRDFGDGDIETIDSFVSANKSLVEAKLRGVTPVLEMYRQNGNQYEVMVAVKMDAEEAMKLAREGIRTELARKSQKLADELDKMLQ